MQRIHIARIWLLFSVYLILNPILAQYTQSGHRMPGNGEIAVNGPGNYGKTGTTYILVNDITSPKTAIFLGKDVTLDLNGYTISYAAGDYEHIPNYSFEEGLSGWDVSKAPTASIEDTKVHVFVGENILRLSAGEEIISPYINLPVSGRSYFAMCGVTKREMRISVFVENTYGNQLRCTTSYSDSTILSCPIKDRSPRLGGGFVFAHLTGVEAGKYRIRIKAETNCFIDHIDLRPAMDVGIGIVEKTHPIGHNDHLYERAHSAFFDYTDDVSLGKPLPGIPVARGKGTVTIKNGIIKSGTTGVLSWGIQSTARDVTIVLDNVKIITSGINTSAVDVPQATITNCFFDVKSPFIINRHGSEFYAVDLRGEKPSEISYSEFFGGQGCLVFKGNYTKVHHNFFANRQTVTNHYSIMAMGDSSLIFENKILPEIGSGIEIYVHRGIEIFNNEIHTVAAPPNCEYGHEEYSTTAIRIADYGARPGSITGSFGNKIYNNRFFITGKDYPDYLDYIPMAWSIFYSASAGDNFIFGNLIVVKDQTPEAKNETAAFYIGGGAIGGHFFDNHITTNTSAAWIASRYGAASDSKIYNNTIVNSDTARGKFQPFRMGWDRNNKSVAKDIQFRSNVIENVDFEIDATKQSHSYSVHWTLKVQVSNKHGKGVAGVEVRILDRSGTEVLNQPTDQNGTVVCELPEYAQLHEKKIISTPYTILVGKKKRNVNLNRNTIVSMVIET